MGAILVNKIKLYAFHGCLEEEAKIGGEYIVDIKIETDFTRAEIDDELNHTVDYCEVYNIVKFEMAIRSKLIEHVARRIADQVFIISDKIEEVEVKVTKENPPVNGNVGSVSAIVTRKSL